VNEVEISLRQPVFGGLLSPNEPSGTSQAEFPVKFRRNSLPYKPSLGLSKGLEKSNILTKKKIMSCSNREQSRESWRHRMHLFYYLASK
jgi:hypothetical protein